MIHTCFTVLHHSYQLMQVNMECPNIVLGGVSKIRQELFQTWRIFIILKNLSFFKTIFGQICSAIFGQNFRTIFDQVSHFWQMDFIVTLLLHIYVAVYTNMRLVMTFERRHKNVNLMWRWSILNIYNSVMVVYTCFYMCTKQFLLQIIYKLYMRREPFKASSRDYHFE